MDHAAAIRAAASERGFSSCGFSSIEPLLPRGPFVRNWLAQGRAGEMLYLQRRLAERLDPTLLLAGVRSVVTLAYPYPPPPAAPRDWRAALRGRIAAYARGSDYHHTVGEHLRRLAERIRGLAPGIEARPYVDTGPILEREWGYRSGLGWFGKNTMLLDQRVGSFFFLAEILTNLELPPGLAAAEHCGTCSRCVDTCPTGALDTEYRIDPRLCISYLTIEHRSAIPHDLRPRLENWIFGCDICQTTCPWNRGSTDTAAFELLNPSLPDILAMDAGAFRARYGKTALSRTKRRGLLRNAAVALGNSGNPDAIPALRRALSDPEPLVRGHAAWALGRLGGLAPRAVLERARAQADPDPGVREEIALALEHAVTGA